MSRGVHRDVVGQAGTRAACFEVEIENFWLRITRLPPRKRANVYLTASWCLTFMRYPGAVPVGTGYTRECELAWFREDCFEALEGR